MPDVSLVATLAGTVLGFILGALWYGPLFGKPWMQEMGMTAEELTKGFNPAKAYGLTFLAGLLAAYVFGLFVGPEPGMTFATSAGFAVGLFWIATAQATNYLFENKSLRLWWINSGYHIVRFTLIGVAFGLLG